jgi:DNA-binding IclR family transcriptional regulator
MLSLAVRTGRAMRAGPPPEHMLRILNAMRSLEAMARLPAQATLIAHLSGLPERQTRRDLGLMRRIGLVVRVRGHGDDSEWSLDADPARTAS